MANTNHLSVSIAKKAAGQVAAELIQNGMIVGLGTGSTARFFIESLGKRCREGLKISAIATSKQSTHLANELGIPLIDPDNITSVDITVDGADEIDQNKNMIKGGGGALLREKLLALSSREMIVIIDQTKIVENLGKHPLPVEIAQFIYQTTIHRIEDEGLEGKLRETKRA